MGITTDNATSNGTFINLLANWMDGYRISFNKTEKHFRCFVHIINLSVRKALQKLENKIKRVCIFNLYLYLYISNFYIYIFIVTRTYY
jgi:hypothetical protein